MKIGLQTLPLCSCVDAIVKPIYMIFILPFWAVLGASINKNSFPPPPLPLPGLRENGGGGGAGQIPRLTYKYNYTCKSKLYKYIQYNTAIQKTPVFTHPN